MNIPIELIKQDEDRPVIVDDRKVEWLSAQMLRDGQYEPVTVREQYAPGEELPNYIIIDGVYRYLAVTRLGWENLEVTVIRQQDYVRFQRLMGVA